MCQFDVVSRGNDSVMW